ncbi:hypothetical protein D3C73_1457460 [compost metagenome]
MQPIRLKPMMKKAITPTMPPLPNRGARIRPNRAMATVVASSVRPCPQRSAASAASGMNRPKKQTPSSWIGRNCSRV